MQTKRIGWYIFVLILGAVVGSVLGDFFAALLPVGTLKTILLKATSFGIPPSLFDLKVVTFTFGFSLKINIVGALGIVLVAYVLRWVEKQS